jgi:hypothetical protein
MKPAPKIRRDEDGCWVWIGARDAHGYGAIGRDGKTAKAHRFMYELFVGPLRHDQTIDHLCRNRACVNPDHLEQVSLAKNKARGDGPCARNARKACCKRGHAFTEENTLLCVRAVGILA